MSVLSPGYQAPSSVGTQGFNSTPTYNMSNDISGVNQQSVLQPISKAGGVASNIAGMFQGFKPIISYKNAQAAVDALGEGGAIKSFGLKAGEELTDKMAQQGVKGTLSSAGTALGVAGAAYGAYNVFNDARSFNDRITGSDIVNMSGRSTQSKNGVNYTSYSGVNSGDIMNYTSAQNTRDTASMTIDAAGTGASIGGLVGSAVPGIGTIIGTVAGGLIGGIGGLVGGLFGSSSRKDKVKESIENTKASMQGFNDQAEAVAGSKGLRDQFYSTHADMGKDAAMSASGRPTFAKGLASPDEGMINLATGETKYLGSPLQWKKDVRADVVPVGGADFEQNVAIPGHKFINGKNGMTFADAARPYFKDNEQIKMMIDNVENGVGDKYTKLKNIMNLNRRKQLNTQAIRNIVSSQQAANPVMADKGKMPRFWEGFDSSMWLPTAGRMLQAANLIGSKQNYNPTSQNSFVENPYEGRALSQMANMRYDIAPQLTEALNTGRQNVYNIKNTAGLTAGQKAAMYIKSNQMQRDAINKAFSDMNNQNNQYKLNYASALMQAGQDRAHRMQQANATQQDMLAKAYGTRFAANQAYANSINNLLQSSIGDYTSMVDKKNAIDYQNKYIGLFNQQLKDNKEIALAQLNRNNGNATAGNAENKYPFIQMFQNNKNRFAIDGFDGDYSNFGSQFTNNQWKLPRKDNVGAIEINPMDILNNVLYRIK